MTRRIKRQRSGLSTFATLSVLCFAVLAVVGAIFIARGGSPPPLALPTVGELEVDAPQSVDVGEPFVVSVAGATEGEVVSLTVDDSYGLRSYESTSRSGRASFTVDPSTSPGSGTFVISARAGFDRGVATVTLTPGPAVDSVALYMGPRTVIANNEDFSMIVAVPVDRLGNPTVVATPVDFFVTRPSDMSGSPSGTIETSTSGLLAYANVEAGIVAGRTTVAVNVGSARGPEQTFLEVADVPVDVELFVQGVAPIADGSTLMEIKTSVLADQHGNVVPDGTIAYLRAEGATGVRRLSAVTIDGVATFVVEAPSRPGRTEFLADVSGATSEPLLVDFAPAVSQFSVRIVPIDNTLEIEVGPVAATDGGYVPDGTIATVAVGPTLIEVELELGSGVVEIDETALPIAVSVLGVVVDEIEDERR